MTTIQDLDDVIEMFPEEANDEDLRIAENRPKLQNPGAGIDILFMSLDGKTYKSGNKLFIR